MLHLACYNGDHPECIKLLLSAKADINALDDRGSTPVYATCAHGAGLGVAKLLEAGAADDTAGVLGYTPMWEAFGLAMPSAS